MVSIEQPTLFEEVPDATSGPFAYFCERLRVEAGPGWADRFGMALRAWARNVVPAPVRTLSLFSGVGGLDIGFHDAGFRIQTAVEIEERFVATLRANAVRGGCLEGTKVLCLDVRDYHPDPAMTIDFVLGGPPCQSFSAAGRRAAGVQGTQDERGTLFQEYVRLLKLLSPKGFLFENVYGITGAEGGKAWEMIKRAFAAAGYAISYRILDAADYGVPQHRERMFIVGVRGGAFLFPAPTHGPDSPDGRPFVSAAAAIEGAAVTEQERQATLRGRFGHLLEEIPEGLNYSFFTEKMGHPRPIFAWRSKFSDFLYKADRNTPIRTLKAQGGQYTGPFHWGNRPFSVPELKRLQTIPDLYEIVGRRQAAIHQIGNSVPPQLARVLAVTILRQLFGVPLPSELPLLPSSHRLGFRQRKRGLTQVYRSKAAAALEERPVHPVANGCKPAARAYSATLTNEFGWVPGESRPLSVQCVRGGAAWLFRVDVGPPHPVESDHAFRIVVRGRPERPWLLGEQTVTLVGGRLQPEVFVGLWKAFEHELSRLDLKADLVQLCGYYHDPPSFSAEMTSLLQNADPRWNVLWRVVEGLGTRDILIGHELALLWGCREGEVLGHALWLRTLGYEARNHRTNHQIPRGSYLIPYAFPTLTPLSVQLRKSLVDEHERREAPS